MPTATHLPRCPHRVAVTSLTNWLTVLLVSSLATSTATVSLNGQEIDYRFVDPASHMQPWPDVEPEVHIIMPAETTLRPPTRIAVKWQTKLREPREEKTPLDDSKLPGPPLEDPSLDDVRSQVELLDLPKNPQDNSANKKQQSSSQQLDCYQAPPLSAMSVSIALPAGNLPANAAAECAMLNEPTGDARLAGAWAGTELHWSATCMRHRPLYFEEINAERYGYTVSYTLQPVISAARFFATIPALPYKMVIERPRHCIYTLGLYRPGSCVPRRWNRLPWKLTAGVIETGFIAGMILIIP